MRSSDYKQTPDGARLMRCGACYSVFPSGCTSLARVMVGNQWVGNVCSACMAERTEALATELAFPYHVGTDSVIEPGELALLNDRRSSFTRARLAPAAAYELGEAYELPNDES